MDYQAINRDNWDSRADVHLCARGYVLDKVADPFPASFTLVARLV